ncbi:MAG: hypothetical protein H0T60_06815 [Acidobacteria bacterium]|nr:hypothetical protein [Acidobacteriota bacterium]
MLGMIAKPVNYYLVGGNPAAAAFPQSNVANNDYGRVARITAATTGLFTIYMDMEYAVTIDAMALLWHNLRAGDTIQVQGATSTANLNAGVGYNSGYVPANTAFTARDYAVPGKFLITFQPQTYRYWRFVIQVSGAALPGGYIQISRALIMKQALFAIGPQRVNIGAEDRNMRLQLESGEERSSEDMLLIRPTCMLDFSYAKESELANVLGNYTLSMGSSKPMFICPDLTASNLQDTIVFGRPTKVIEVSSDQYDIWKFQAQVTSIGP